jgi:hypothetical protein
MVAPVAPLLVAAAPPVPVVVLPVLVIAAEVVALPVLAIGVEVVALPVPTLAEPVVFDTALEVAGPVAAPGAPAPAIPSEPEQAVSVTKSAHRGQRTPGCDNQFLMSYPWPNLSGVQWS